MIERNGIGLEGVHTAILRSRRKALGDCVTAPVLLWAGDRLSRNFRANPYPFRASSHFLYFAGLPLPGAILYLVGDRQWLLFDKPTEADALWHGEFIGLDVLGEALGVDRILPKSALLQFVEGAVTIPLVDPWGRSQQSQLLGRELPEPHQLTGGDRQLAEAIIQLRLCHDAAALQEIQAAVAVSVQAHQRGMQTVRQVDTEIWVRTAIEAEIYTHAMTCAYPSIVTTHGEILHHESSPHRLNDGDLLLVDAGAETALGWAADLTRTYPVNGKFSATQRAIYDIVLAAHDQAIAAIRPDVEFRAIHHLAAQVLAEGLLDLGILNGNIDTILEHNVHALFFPHGIGHLLGLDVHDMEDLGDLAGYAPNRSRSEKFGECFLRCDRPLRENMIVTIEPGFYQIPALLNRPETRQQYDPYINWERLSEFNDVRGIRIEDDILVTAAGANVLSQTLPTKATDIENFMNA